MPRPMRNNNTRRKIASGLLVNQRNAIFAQMPSWGTAGMSSAIRYINFIDAFINFIDFNLPHKPISNIRKTTDKTNICN